MAKTRLTQHHRDTLVLLAFNLVKAPAEQAALDASYEVASAAVRVLVLAKYPHKDMLILKRYDAARPDPCIYLDSTGGRLRFEFRTAEEAPLVPSNRGCGSRSYLPEPEAAASVEAWSAAVKTLKEALDGKMADYKGLITASRTFEDVVEVWPEAEQLRTRICGARQALSIVSDELVARIRADVQARAA